VLAGEAHAAEDGLDCEEAAHVWRVMLLVLFKPFYGLF
jgi:hypothetical protein